MNKDIQKLWVSALRSGEYNQRFGSLKLPEEDGWEAGHCCLGVLCELYDASEANDEGTLWSSVKKGGRYGAAFEYDGDPNFPSNRVLDWAEIDKEFRENGGDVTSCKGRVLSQLNDSGSTFDEIAKFIEDGFDGAEPVKSKPYLNY